MSIVAGGFGVFFSSAGHSLSSIWTANPVHSIVRRLPRRVPNSCGLLPVLDVIVQSVAVLLGKQHDVELAVVAHDIRGQERIGPDVRHVEHFEQQVASGDMRAVQRSLDFDYRAIGKLLPEDLLRVGDLDPGVFQLVDRFVVPVWSRSAARCRCPR